MEPSITVLVEQALTGDTTAQTSLYMLTKNKAYYLALQLLKNPQDAEDVLQDAYITAFSKLKTLDNAEKFQGWLDTIVINRAKDVLKKKKPIVFADMKTEDGDDYVPELEEDRIEFQPQENMDYQETKRLVQEIIDGLSEEQRIAVMLYYYKDMSVAEIAAYSECSVNTIKSRLNYARKTIKSEVEELEKKGTKLYAVPVLPFIYWLLRAEAEQTVCAATNILQGIQASSTIGKIAEETLNSPMDSITNIAKESIGKGNLGNGVNGAFAVTKAAKLGFGMKAGIAAAIVTLGVTGSVLLYKFIPEESSKDNAEQLVASIQMVTDKLKSEMDPSKIKSFEIKLSDENSSEIKAVEEKKESKGFTKGIYSTSIPGMPQELEIYEVNDKEIVFSMNCSNAQGNVGSIEKTSAPIIEENVAVFSDKDGIFDFQLKFNYTGDGTVEISEILGQETPFNPYCGMGVYMNGTYVIESKKIDENYKKLTSYGCKGNLWVDNITNIEETEDYYLLTADVYTPTYITEEDFKEVKKGLINAWNIAGILYMIETMTESDKAEHAGEYKFVNKEEEYYIDNNDNLQAEGDIEDYYDTVNGFQYLSPEGCYYIKDKNGNPMHTILEPQISLKVSKEAAIEMLNEGGEQYQQYTMMDCINQMITGKQGQTLAESSGQVVFDESGVIIKFYEDYYK